MDAWIDAVLVADRGRPALRRRRWLRLPFWDCTAYMAVGKGVRHVVATAGLLRLWPGAYGG